MAVLLFAVLLIYCGVKGRSLKNALTGHSVAGATGGIAGAP